MKKGLKNFLIGFVGAVLFFILSFIVQYYFSVWSTIKVIMALAGENAIIGFFVTIGILYIKPSQETFSVVEIFILRFIAIFMSLSFLMLISTLGNAILNDLSIICFVIGFILSMIGILYAVIKVIIVTYQEYKEKQ